MARRWTEKEEKEKRKELKNLYVKENKTISEIGDILHIGQSTVHQRLIRLNIPVDPSRKLHYRNIQYSVKLRKYYSNKLAEFIGIMLGDGHISHTQVTVTLGSKEDEYVQYVSKLMNEIFNTNSRICIRRTGYKVVYIGSVLAVKWLETMGLTHNKVKYQVDVPKWIFTKDSYIKNAIRGLIDTDGSVYKLKFGVQISFCNNSQPLLNSARLMLIKLGFHPSKICNNKQFYLTRQQDLKKFFKEIGFSNSKHYRRFIDFIKNNGQMSE